MKLVIYSRVFPPAVGGMERFVEDLAGWFAQKGHDVTVSTLTPDDSNLDREREYRVLRQPRLSILRRAIRGSGAVLINGLSLRGISATSMSGRRPILTHAGYQAICPIGLAWSSQGQCTAGPDPGPCPSCPGRGVQGIAKVRAHRVGASYAVSNVCVSRYLQKRIGVPRDLTIYNPVSRRAFDMHSGDSGVGLIAFAGRMVKEKGLDLLLRALVLVPEARLEVAGDGPMRGIWGRMAQELGVSPRVRFLGSLPFEGVADLYARASVVCVPTFCEEAFGYACAEAMAMSRAVVATPRGALPELLAKGRGFICDEATPESLASSLDTVLRDDSLRREVGRRARSFAERELDVEMVGQRYLSLCQEASV